VTWYRSLYWRIAIGFVLFLAAMLVVQAVFFTWVVARSGYTLPGQTPSAFAQTVALDVATAVERDATVDLEKFVREQYAQANHPFHIVLADGRIINHGATTIAEPLLRLARARLRRGPGRFERSERPGERPGGERPFDRDAPGGFGAGGPGAGPLGGVFRRNPAPIVVNGQTIGVVVVPPNAPFGFLLRRFAPTLSLVAAGVLIVGTVLASVLIFGPARRRLRQVEGAARRLGGGDLSARAPERGGDEIAAVASAFNTMAADLGAREAALLESDRVRRQLLADVSHELTTPVTAMRGYLETLTMPELSLDEPTRARYLGIISDETARLERIIGDLLDLARLEGGGGALAIESVPVAVLFDRVAARHERACQEAGVTIAQTIALGAELVDGDRDRLEQALQNLAANAIRYSPAGSTLRLIARPHADGVALSVVDEGSGIPPEHLPHVFDRFYKADASRHGTTGGSGLGLSIVKAIVERHGGRISVASVPGRTAFELVLPHAILAAPDDLVLRTQG
jgi:signal transduction histidine kinase